MQNVLLLSEIANHQRKYHVSTLLTTANKKILLWLWRVIFKKLFLKVINLNQWGGKLKYFQVNFSRDANFLKFQNKYWWIQINFSRISLEKLILPNWKIFDEFWSIFQHVSYIEAHFLISMQHLFLISLLNFFPIIWFFQRLTETNNYWINHSRINLNLIFRLN